MCPGGKNFFIAGEEECPQAGFSLARARTGARALRMKEPGREGPCPVFAILRCRRFGLDKFRTAVAS